MLIDISYFVLDLDIHGLSTQAVKMRVDSFIDKYEPIFLAKLFDEALHSAYIAGTTAETVQAIWTALQTPGLKKAIACYVFFYYMRSGNQKPETKEDREKVFQDSVNAWNQMAEEVGRLYDYLDTNKALYPTWQPYYRYRSELAQPINTFNL